MNRVFTAEDFEAVTVTGRVESGIGIAAQHIAAASDELEIIFGRRPLAGSLNVRLDRPLAMNRSTATIFDNGQRLTWPARLNGKPALLYRWANCPLHVAEFLSPDHIRTALQVADGDRVTVEVDPSHLAPTPVIAWSLLWRGRESWVRKRHYELVASRLGARFGFGLERFSLFAFARRLWRFLRRLPSRPYLFHRIEAEGDPQKIVNLLNYTKTGAASYSASRYPAGYHSIDLGGRILRGQRDPAARLSHTPIDFTGKTILDFGSNQGGMLFALSDKLKWGIGVDYDPRMVNAANRIKRAKDAHNLDFYVFDLERENLNLIHDFLPEGRVDVCFLLSICMWLNNWREVIEFAASIADLILFETNGTNAQQDWQLTALEKHCRKVQILAEESTDDPGQKRRKLFLARV